MARGIFFAKGPKKVLTLRKTLVTYDIHANLLCVTKEHDKTMFYYLSLGSNIEPETNASKMMVLLAQQFGPFVCYPFVYTQPENINTTNIFLNSLAVVYSTFAKDTLKARLNSIEEALGRDRNDPDRSVKDRTADIDILGVSNTQDLDFFLNYKESYIRDIVVTNKSTQFFSPSELAASEGPSTIDFDRTSGHVRIVDYRTNSLIDWHKPTLVGQ